MPELRLFGVRLSRACLAWLVLTLTACGTSVGGQRTSSTPPQPEVLTPVDGATVDVMRSRLLNHFDFAAPVEKVWAAIMEVQAAIGIPVASFDTGKHTGMFVAQNRYRRILDQPASLFLDCGTGPTGPKADSYRLLIRVHHALATGDDANSSVLTTGLEVYATNPGVSGDQVPCTSTGRLERDLAALIEARLQQAK